MVLAQVFTLAFCLYIVVGLIAAAWLLALGGLVRIEPKSASASFAARLIWLPACVALWPFLVRRARRMQAPRPPVLETNAEARP